MTEVLEHLKQCTKCLLNKPLDQFHKATNSKKLSYHCKACIAVRDKERYKKCREEVNLWTSEIYEGVELEYQLNLIGSLSNTEISALRAKLNKLLDKTPKVDVAKQKRDHYLRNKEKINKKNKEYYENNKERMLEWQRQYTKDHLEQVRVTKNNWQRSNFMRRKLSQAKTRSERNNLNFNVTLDDLLVPEFCPILGIPLYLSETGVKCANSPSIDRIINEDGYMKGNVHIISSKANTMKSDASPVDLLLFSYWVLNTFDPEVYLGDYTLTEQTK